MNSTTLLSLPFDGRYAALDLTPREQKERTILALIDLLGGLAKQRPVLFILEDAHWIDPTTLELFTRTIDQLQRWPVLLIVTFRPEFEVRWRHYPHVTALALDRLGQSHVVAMIDSLTEGKLLPADVRDAVIAKTDSVPTSASDGLKGLLNQDHVRTSVPISAPQPAQKPPTNVASRIAGK